MSKPSDQLSIQYFAFEGPSFTITYTYTDPELIYQWCRAGVYAPPDHEICLKPDQQAWHSFWTQVRLVGAWYWQPQYDGHALDGEQWTIKLNHDGKSMQTLLVNAYPPEGDREPSEAFKQFLIAVGVLMDDNEFVNYWYHNKQDRLYGHTL